MPIFRLADNNYLFPPVELAEPDGLLAVGGDLSSGRLLAAYSQGIFPWYDQGPLILWWSTQPRCVLFPAKLHVPASLRRLLRSGQFSFSVNQAFATVIESCARVRRPGQPGTWILPEMVQAYCHLHQLGRAHSVEVWQDGQLVGGLYGVSLGRVFFGESMFYLRPNASKAALVWLVQNLQSLDFALIDCQQKTDHLLRFGAELIEREKFSAIVAQAAAAPESPEILAFWRGGAAV